MIKYILAVLAVMMFVSAPLPVYAVELFKDTCSGPDTAASAVCIEKDKTGDPITGPDGIVLKAVDIIAFVAGVAAILAILVGGIKYVTSNGDSGGVSSAKQTILYALIGLVIIVLSRAIITFVISKI